VVGLPETLANREAGIFANIFRLALLTTIMIQAFRMAAEPFFFNQSKSENAQKTYARVMKFFVIACCFMFLFIGLFLDVFQWIFLTFSSKHWVEGFRAIPLLALGNIFLGIYYNLSIWYKLTNKNTIGAVITIAGAIITIVLNILLIPRFHYYGAAIATFSCYFFMMLCSYKLGQKYYPVPYARKKLTAYIVLVVLIYMTHWGFNALAGDHLWLSITSAMLLLYFFLRFVMKIEAKELSKISILSRFY
jgi:O-antigen/teichoic acid export membrane protein